MEIDCNCGNAACHACAVRHSIPEGMITSELRIFIDGVYYKLADSLDLVERNEEFFTMREMVEEAMEEEEKAIHAARKDNKVKACAEAYDEMHDGRQQRKQKRKYIRKQVLTDYPAINLDCEKVLSFCP